MEYHSAWENLPDFTVINHVVEEAFAQQGRGLLQMQIPDNAALTDISTGAAGAVAAKHLCRKKEIVLGLVGTGHKAQHQLEAIAKAFTIREVKIWSRDKKEAELFQQNNSRYTISLCNPKRTCDCDVLVTSTASEAPVVKARWIHPGTHINAAGADAPGKQELDPSLLVIGRVFVDDREQAIRAGEINVPVKRGFFHPSDIAGTLSEVVRGEKGRTHDDQITIFDSTGLNPVDPAVASLVMRYGRSHTPAGDRPFRISTPAQSIAGIIGNIEAEKQQELLHTIDLAKQLQGFV